MVSAAATAMTPTADATYGIHGQRMRRILGWLLLGQAAPHWAGVVRCLWGGLFEQRLGVRCRVPTGGPSAACDCVTRLAPQLKRVYLQADELPLGPPMR